MVCTQCRTSTTWRAQVWNMTALSAFPAGASQGAVGWRGAQGRWARQQCREESVGVGQAPSTPWGTRGQQASPFQLHHKATFFFFFFCILWFFFSSINISKEESKGRCLSRVFVVVVVVVLGGIVFICCCLFHFSKGKGRERLLQQSPVFACNGPWADGCSIHTDSSPGACWPPSCHPHRKESQQTYPWQRSFG